MALAVSSTMTLFSTVTAALRDDLQEIKGRVRRDLVQFK
jgi:hypothetical protein